MKKLGIVVGIAFLTFQGVYADEALPKQTVKNEQSYFMANLQKQPQEGRQKQGITNHFTFFTINVQINGKIKDSDTAVSAGE